ncbi:DNA-binding CsgD family transcriptional regulator [Kitasatospora sp. MAP12-15]|uniref:helix-turn-helix transcriptional regulator n=1 Tax=unclassified Kitasatospora TaxID=2633591 RepID=UPI002475CDD3|nr:helix-turn-helix transcriptional regulator [Kitasatospora sp. MAP12-44]MDH6111411.1 DNA-binding CsgD family transcriptional regulator [Kitasatospora sp. MAP12-44]
MSIEALSAVPSGDALSGTPRGATACGSGTARRADGLRQDASALSLVVLLAGPATLKNIARRREPGTVEPAALYTQHGVRRAGLVALYTLAGHIRHSHIGVDQPLRSADDLSDRERQLLRLLARDLTIEQIAGALRMGREVVSARIRSLLRALGVECRHQAVALACLADVVARTDVLPDSAPGRGAAVLPAWLPESEVDRLVRALDRSPACAVVPHAGQHQLAEAVARRYAPGGRILIVTGDDTGFAAALTRWRAFNWTGQPVAGLLAVSDRSRPSLRALGLRAPLPVAADRILDHVGKPGALVAVATSHGLKALAEAHRRWPGRIPPWNLVITYNAQLLDPETTSPSLLPTRARLYVTAIEESTTCDRTAHDRVNETITGPVILRSAMAALAACGAARPYRMLAAAPPGGRAGDRLRLQMLLIDLAAHFKLTRIQLHCSTSRDASALVSDFDEAVALMESWMRPRTFQAGHLSASDSSSDRTAILHRFRSGPEALRILATTEPLPDAAPDALVHLAHQLPTHRTAQVIGHALTAHPGTAQPVLLVAPVLPWPDRQIQDAAHCLASLTRAVAALDGDQRGHLAQLRRHGHTVDHPAWLATTARTLDPADSGRLTDVAAWADATWSQECAALASACELERIGPSGLTLTQIERTLTGLGQPLPGRGAGRAGVGVM